MTSARPTISPSDTEQKLKGVVDGYAKTFA